MDNTLKNSLQRFALQIRISIFEQFKSRGFGHVGGCLSIADTLAVLYGAVMKYDPQNPSWVGRDKLVCSKGHAGPAIYGTLALKGFFPYELLKTLNRPGTILPSHCDQRKTPGIDMTTGSLGQGTSMAVGMALGNKIKGRDARIFLLVGDGESNEGQVWEAAMLASARQLDNLYWFVDENKKQLDGTTKEILNMGSIADKMEAFGFDTQRVNGNDVACIYDAIERAGTVKNKPHAIILDTIKGAGVKEIEETAANHAMNLPAEKWAKWQADLESELEAFDVHGGEAV